MSETYFNRDVRFTPESGRNSLCLLRAKSGPMQRSKRIVIR
jgi:hypothetical protein